MVMLRQLTREPVLAAGVALAVVPPALVHFLSTEKVAWGGFAQAQPRSRRSCSPSRPRGETTGAA
jgi:hypothetical protein